MSNKIGRFEILSELAHSETCSVYKASDTESNQTVALKTMRLEAVGDQAAALEASLVQEAEASKVLNSPNIALLYGAGKMDGVFAASLEYVQGNSVATMLARKEGFSIWDLMDIARQACQGLDHAHTKNVFHYTLEPAKIMVSWDGTVKLLGFGISQMSAFAAQAAGAPALVLHYMSPEQLRGDPLDARSNIFTLGAILYEMVTECKAFDGENADQVRQAVSETAPTAPYQINRKIHPALSEVIIKALAKAPEDRYQSGQDLVNDLERCKESSTKAAKPNSLPQKAQTIQKPMAAGPTPKPTVSVPAAINAPASVTPRPTAPKAAPATTPLSAPPMHAATKAVPEKAAAAVAGASASSTSHAESELMAGFSAGPASMSTAPMIEPEYQAPKIAVDPMMAESQAGTKMRSFSEIDELPPLKEIHIAPAPPPPPAPEPLQAAQPVVFHPKETEKPRIQPREVAKKAVNEIAKTPPHLFLYSVGAALVVMLLIIAGIAYHIHAGNSDDDSTPVPTPAAEVAPAKANPAPAQPVAQATAGPSTQVDAQPEPIETGNTNVSIKPKYNAKKKSKPVPVAAPAVVPGALNLASSPSGAQVQIDGQSNPAWVTPYDISGLTPGQHTISISKPGFNTDTRTIEVAPGGKSFVSVQLGAMTATASLNTEPAGAEIWMDGRDTGKATPAQIVVDKPGNHTFTFKKQGYLEETSTANLQIGQISHVAPALKALGNSDDLRMGGKFKKLFGGSDTVGMGSVLVRTQPKGAQIAVNNRMLDRNSPVEFFLNPGNYVVDITMSGFKDVHKVITVEKNGKVAIDENLDRE